MHLFVCVFRTENTEKFIGIEKLFRNGNNQIRVSRFCTIGAKMGRIKIFRLEVPKLDKKGVIDPKIGRIRAFLLKSSQ